MASSRNVAVVVGSLRKDSINRKMAAALIGLAPKTLSCAFAEIGDLSLYNQDFDANPPASWVAFRDKIRPVDAVLFVTPEYNRSVPGVLKNAIDIGSRPYGQSVWDKKPAGIVSVSPSGMGGFGSNHHLRQSLVSFNMPTMAQPEAYIAHGDKLFDADGKFAEERTKGFMQKFIDAFATWIETHATAG
ncbi:MAG: NAD(P)H-dependent oxidoreductase [Rhodospirillaceae bacterium]|nr:NAD(P)H-dependent oxidoreductase [Rhodospirillaceae bacterium]